MRRVREFASLLTILSLAVVPMISVGCHDQSASAPPAVSKDASKTTDKAAATKPPKKKKSPSAEGGSTTGDLGVKPPKTPNAGK